MKLHCAKSGIVITCPEFRHSLADNSHSYCHPIFSASPKLLTRAYDDWATGTLRDEEIVLLFLAIANSTQLIHWRHPFSITTDAAGIFNLHMEELAKVALNLRHLQERGLQLPAFVCERQNKQNEASAFSRCVSIWRAELSAYDSRAANAIASRALLRAEEHMERARLLAQKRPGSYARAVAQWAAAVGEFPTRATCTASHASISMSELWQDTIVKCILAEGRTDPVVVAQILGYCEENVPAGSTHACALFDALRQRMKQEELKFGFALLTPTSNMPLTAIEQASRDKEVAMLKELRAQASVTKPTREDYTSYFSYMRALAIWNTAQQPLPGDKVVASTVSTACANEDGEDL